MKRALLTPLNPLYRAVVEVESSAYSRGWLRAKRLRQPVVSIGNLSVGGAGKTPLTIRLAELLHADGITVDVLSRGYGRNSTATERVIVDGRAERFGDEPLLIARRTGLPVFVGASRYKAGLLAEESPSARDENPGTPAALQVHLLDDGFQHKKLKRDVDVVLLHRSDFTERLLPAGRLREPLSALRRADFVVLREEDSESASALQRLDISAAIWWMRRSLSVPIPPAGQEVRAIAFCGIAHPADFFSSLRANGVDLAESIAFADHHRYLISDIDRLARQAKDSQATAFVTTEKDAVKLDASMMKKLESSAPVHVARLEVVLRNEPAIMRDLRAKLFAHED